MKILGVSGSPIKNSNTDRAVKTVLEATGKAHCKIIDSERRIPNVGR